MLNSRFKEYQRFYGYISWEGHRCNRWTRPHVLGTTKAREVGGSLREHVDQIGYMIVYESYEYIMYNIRVYICVCVVPALLQQRRHDSGDVLARPIWCGRLMVTTYLMMVKRRMMTMMTMIMIYYDHDDGDDAGDHQIIRSSTTTIIIIIALFKIKVWSMFSHGL